MTESTSYRSHLGKDTAHFLSMLAVSACASVLGYGCAMWFFGCSSTFALSFADLYAGCHFPIEFLCRSAVLCRPFLIDAALLLLIAYSKFEKALSVLYFLVRGIAFGTALFVTLRTSAVSMHLYLPVIYMAATLLYLVFSRTLRTHEDLRARSDALVYTGIAAGAASLLFTAATLLVTIPI